MNAWLDKSEKKFSFPQGCIIDPSCSYWSLLELSGRDTKSTCRSFCFIQEMFPFAAVWAPWTWWRLVLYFLRLRLKLLKAFQTAVCTEIGEGRQKSNARCPGHLWIYFLRLQVSLGELAGKCRCTFIIVLFVQTDTMLTSFWPICTVIQWDCFAVCHLGMWIFQEQILMKVLRM
jgi:hypothetical protein